MGVAEAPAIGQVALGSVKWGWDDAWDNWGTVYFGGNERRRNQESVNGLLHGVVIGKLHAKSKREMVYERFGRVVELETCKRSGLEDAGDVDDAALAGPGFKKWKHHFGKQRWMNHINSHKIIHVRIREAI